MLLKDVSLPRPEENILYDEVLLQLAEQGKSGEVLRFWESSQMFVVLGRICKEEDDLKVDAIRKDQIPVLRRASGGGTVLQGKGCFNYTLVLSKEKNFQVMDLRKSYEYILGKVIAALKQIGVNAVFCPISDLALASNHKKISGNAQKRARKFILHHGTVLYDFDLSQIEKYLRMPKDIPEYRRQRSHLDFVTNTGLTVDEIKNALKHVFDIDHQDNDLNNEETDCLQALSRLRDVRVKFTLGE